MKAVILAAGVGKRLAPVAAGRPKCLIELGGRTLLARHVENLSSRGIHPIVVVVGYEHSRIREALRTEEHSGTVRFLVNEHFTRGSITSLWRARSELNDDAVIMDADVLYAPSLLDRLVASRSANAVLLDETVRQQTEECMVAVREGRVVSLSKRLPQQFDLAGEGVGFLKVSKEAIPELIDSVRSWIEAGRLDMEYEDALEGFFRTVPVGFERIGGLPWIEIDFPEDLRRAETEVLPFLNEEPHRRAPVAPVIY